jgi:hypothetical protein
MVRFRMPLVALLALTFSACGGGSSTTVAPPLFQDAFDGTFPGTGWTAVTGTASAAPSSAIGNPAKSLAFTTLAPTSTASTTTTMSFTNPNVTFTVQEAASMTTPGLKGTSTITILDGTAAVVAYATWDPESTQISYSILGSAPITPIGTPAADGTFHTFRFRVDTTGKATWSLDGADKVFNPGFPAGALTLKLSAAFGTGTAWPEFDFDNVTVASP